MLTDAYTGEPRSNLWLIVYLPAIVACWFFAAVGAATGIAWLLPIIDRVPLLVGGPSFGNVDEWFTSAVYRFDGWLVGLVGLATIWWLAIPALVAAVALDRSNTD